MLSLLHMGRQALPEISLPCIEYDQVPNVALLALHIVSELLDPLRGIAGAVRTAAHFQLDHQPHSSWNLYPEIQNAGARRQSPGIEDKSL